MLIVRKELHVQYKCKKALDTADCLLLCMNEYSSLHIRRIWQRDQN